MLLYKALLFSAAIYAINFFCARKNYMFENIKFALVLSFL